MTTIQKDTYTYTHEWGLNADEWRDQTERALSVKLTTMTPEQYRAALDRLSLSQVEAARVMGVSRNTAHNYARSGPPGPVALLLRMLMHAVEREGGLDAGLWIPSRLRPT